MKKLVQNQAVRYIFFGCCTTAVNLVSYYLLCLAGFNITVANTIAVFLAILFAYVVNKLFVFEHKTHSFVELCKEAGSFIGMRMGTMAVEVFGVLCLTCIWGVPNMISKVLIQVVILVLNYLISKLVVFKDSKDEETETSSQANGRGLSNGQAEKGSDATTSSAAKHLSRNYFLAGFFLSGIVALIGFARMGVWPFGDKTLLIIDSLHQYLPFYTDFHEKLTNSESFLYSFSGGLGYNFWSTYAYYMASPLNFLMAFIPTANVCDFMDLMILLKIALCGGCFSWYMHKRDEERKYLPAVFGVMYALSNFVIGYYFNLMWLDSIAMLPLVMYGIERIVKGGKGKFYCLALFYGLWCNYYIGFMLCLFACLYFLVCWIAETGEYGKHDEGGAGVFAAWKEKARRRTEAERSTVEPAISEAGRPAAEPALSEAGRPAAEPVLSATGRATAEPAASEATAENLHGTARENPLEIEFSAENGKTAEKSWRRSREKEKAGKSGATENKSNTNRTGKSDSGKTGSFPRNLGKSCLTFAWYSLLAGGMAAVLLVPAFMGLTASESMDGNTFPTVVKFYENLAELLENHMAFMEPVTISSTQVGLNVYCGVATVLFALLYLFDREIRLRERLAHYGLCALLLFSFACNIPNYIWHGFHTQNGLPNRFAFIYIAILLVMAYDALGHLKKYWLPEIVFAVAVPVAFLIVRYLEPEQELEGYLFLISIGLLIFYFAFVLIGRYASRLKPAYFSLALSCVLFIEVTANALYGIEQNGSVTRSIYLADQSSYQALIAGLDEDEDSFYRSEVDRQRMRNVTMYVGGNALVMFNSTMQASIVDFCDALGIEARTNKNGYLGVTKLMNDVFGIKYVATPSGTADTFYQFEKVDTDGELTLYENANALSLGFMVDDAILEWDTSSGEPLDIQNSFVELATGHEAIYVLDRYIDMEDGETYGIKIPENKQVYMCIDTRVEKIELTTPEYSKTYSTYTDHLYVINGTEESNLAEFTVTLKSSQTTVQAQIYTCSNVAYQEVVDELAESQLENVAVDGNTVTGDIDVKETGTLLLTIPYDEGWTILVDGEETEFSCVGGALIGVHLEAGTHSIEMKYTPAGLWVGSGLSLLSALLFLGTLAWEKRKRFVLA